MDTTRQAYPQSYTPEHEGPKTTKLIIAVHGIGDQTACETIQSVALRISAYNGRPVTTPLGRFYPKAGTPGSQAAISALPVLMNDSEDPDELRSLGLAEAYWAPIPRAVATQKYVLEETKKWARTIAARVAYSDDNRSAPASTPAQREAKARKAERIVFVLDELVESIRLLERLTFLSDKAGLFKLDIGKLLVDFVGDVQLVADFEAYRQQIIATFDGTIQQACALADGTRPELYIVAHSEGSVIAFLALLQALADPDAYPWIRNVRGLMTIGSPIEIHHLMWPHLWQRKGFVPNTAGLGTVRGDAERDEARPFSIPWHNYMDHGDPIAYELTSTRAWLDDTGFAKHLDLHEHQFNRYFLPGKAHVDYWSDDEVFGHFLREVVELPVNGDAARDASAAAATATPKKSDIPDRPLARLTAWCAPYVLVALLLFAAVYAMLSGVSAALDTKPDLAGVARDVTGIGLLLLGITAAARLPRVADDERWTAIGWIALLFSISAFTLITREDTIRASGGAIVISAIAAGIAAASGFVAVRWPRFGRAALPSFGLIGAIAVVAGIVRAASSLWPVIVGCAFFFYLWWLSSLLFDLVFVWQRYIRNAAVREHLAQTTIARHAEERRERSDGVARPRPMETRGSSIGIILITLGVVIALALSVFLIMRAARSPDRALEHMLDPAPTPTPTGAQPLDSGIRTPVSGTVTSDTLITVDTLSGTAGVGHGPVVLAFCWSHGVGVQGMNQDLKWMLSQTAADSTEFAGRRVRLHDYIRQLRPDVEQMSRMDGFIGLVSVGMASRELDGARADANAFEEQRAEKRASVIGAELNTLVDSSILAHPITVGMLNLGRFRAEDSLRGAPERTADERRVMVLAVAGTGAAANEAAAVREALANAARPQKRRMKCLPFDPMRYSLFDRASIEPLRTRLPAGE